MYCNKCKSVMKKVFVFENDNSYRMFKCPICGFVTKGTFIKFDKDGNIIENSKNKFKKR